MFNKKNKLDFETENYIMPDTFKTSELYVGNLEYVSSEANDYVSPICITTEQKYIFKRQKDKFVEVLTGFIASDHAQAFDLPYVVDVMPIDDCVEDLAPTLPKFSLLKVIDQVNNKDKSKKLSHLL